MSSPGWSKALDKPKEREKTKTKTNKKKKKPETLHPCYCQCCSSHPTPHVNPLIAKFTARCLNRLAVRSKGEGDFNK